MRQYNPTNKRFEYIIEIILIDNNGIFGMVYKFPNEKARTEFIIESMRLAKNNGFHVAMKALGEKLAAREAQGVSTAGAKKAQPEVKIEYADLLQASSEVRGPEAAERNRDIANLNNPASMNAVNEVVKYASLMGWKYDAGRPASTQIRFSKLYEKYTKEYGVA